MSTGSEAARGAPHNRERDLPERGRRLRARDELRNCELLVVVAASLAVARAA